MSPSFHAELMCVIIYWLANTCVSMCWNPFNVVYEFVVTSPAVPSKSCLTCKVCKMGCKWPYSDCFVEYCFQDLFKTARSIFKWFPFSFFSSRFVTVHDVQSYNRKDTAREVERIPVLFYRRYLSMWSITRQKQYMLYQCKFYIAFSR